jgi:hypothetical protein
MSVKIVDFSVEEPLVVPLDGLRNIDERRARELFNEVGEGLALAKGCYVFALRSGRGSMPLYVGRTTRASFRMECFNHKNVKDLNKALEVARGTLLLYLIRYMRSGAGAGNRSAIEALETQLIGIALERNPKILNIHGARPKSLPRIQGVLNSSRGRPTRQAHEFKKMLAL